MQTQICSACGAPLAQDYKSCEYCGAARQVVPSQPAQPTPPPGNYTQFSHMQSGQHAQHPPYSHNHQQYQQFEQYQYQHRSTYQKPLKNKIVAGILGILLGGIGVHKFYLGKIFQGILYILFCWTYIPAFIGFIEGIIYLVMREDKFHEKYSR